MQKEIIQHSGQEEIAQLLREKGVRPTAIRILLWRTLEKFDFAFSMSDLEGLLPTVDRSTIFRALTLFVERELLHVLDDGSGQHKYCICLEEEENCDSLEKDESHTQCQHVHLTCVKCGRTYCIREAHIPQVSIPVGFEVLHMNYVIQGICPKCGHKR